MPGNSHPPFDPNFHGNPLTQALLEPILFVSKKKEGRIRSHPDGYQRFKARHWVLSNAQDPRLEVGRGWELGWNGPYFLQVPFLTYLDVLYVYGSMPLV